MLIVVGNWGRGKIWRITSGEFTSNAYFCEIGCNKSGILIDPGLDSATIAKVLNEKDFRPTKILCTHGHFDHIAGAHYFQNIYNIDAFLHKADERIMKSSNFLLMLMKLSSRVRLADFSFVNDQFAFEIEGIQIRFQHAPGHTPGSCIIQIGSAWFTGDTLYSHGVGLSALPGEDSTLLKVTIESLWPNLTENINIFPGHGDSANGQEIRKSNIPLLKFLGK